MMTFQRALFLLFFSILTFASPTGHCQPSHGLAMVGDLALSKDFTSLPYAFAKAPKGGAYREAVVGTFDTLNPFFLTGTPAEGLRFYVYESLLARNKAEPFSLYGLIAQGVERGADGRSVTFFLNPKAAFSDGTPLTSQDVVFSWKTLLKKGRPNFQLAYGKVARVETPSPHEVTFYFKEPDRELPLILGLMPVLPAHAFGKNITSSFALPIGSGPYRVAHVEPGQTITYRRHLGYWGKDLSINRGLWNFDTVTFTYFRQHAAAHEAFKRGEVDLRVEDSPTRWQNGYDGLDPSGSSSPHLVRETLVPNVPAPAFFLALNTRRFALSDPRVRQALGLLFDFSWMNAHFYHGLMVRTEGFFSHSSLSAFGSVASLRERALLDRHNRVLPLPFLQGTWRPHPGSENGYDRAVQRRALTLFKQAGWSLQGGALRHIQTHTPMTLELLVHTQDQEKIGLTYARSLSTLGISLSVRRVDGAQFEGRLKAYDFDLVPYVLSNSLSPGHEQAFYWGCASGKTQGTRNYPGVCDRAVDAAIAALIGAKTRTALEEYARLLDRLLVSGFYVIPLFHPKGQWIARWSPVHRPEKTSLYGLDREALWFEKEHTP